MARPISSRTRALLDRLIRVDHAGELGAKYIYEGQLAVLKNTKSAPIIQQMLDGEKHHLKTFEELIPKNRVRPTALLPLFRIAAYGLGVATGLLGEKSAMACTVAVESVVGDHYNNQIRELLQEDPKAHTELLEILKQFRDEEMEHHDTGLANEAELTTGGHSACDLQSIFIPVDSTDPSPIENLLTIIKRHWHKANKKLAMHEKLEP